MDTIQFKGKKVPEPPYSPINTLKKEVVTYNGADFHTTRWSVPEGTAVKGRVIFVHGFCESACQYVRILDDLASQGYESFFFDQRGSGWTSPDKTKGLTDEFHTFDDLDFFIKMNIDEIGPDMKLFMGGHSMGGGIALNYGITGQYKDRLSGIFVTGPLILLHPRTRPNKWLRSFSELVAKVWPTKKIDTELVKHYVTADEEWADFIAENPILTPFIGTLRQISDFLKRGENLMNPEHAQKFDKVPLLLMHGAEDNINDPEASKKFFEMISIEDKSLLIVDKSRHSCFIEREETYKDCTAALFKWLDEH